jgi:hypothetical protein
MRAECEDMGKIALNRFQPLRHVPCRTAQQEIGNGTLTRCTLAALEQKLAVEKLWRAQGDTPGFLRSCP